MELRINYEQVLAQVALLKVEETELGIQITRLKAIEQEVKMAWSGPAAQAFLVKLRDLIADLNKTKLKLGQLIGKIKLIADKIKLQDEIVSHAILHV